MIRDISRSAVDKAVEHLKQEGPTYRIIPIERGPGVIAEGQRQVGQKSINFRNCVNTIDAMTDGERKDFFLAHYVGDTNTEEGQKRLQIIEKFEAADIAEGLRVEWAEVRGRLQNAAQEYERMAARLL